MNKENKNNFLIPLMLSFVGGFLDIYTYLARGKVFANTQTGNLVLLGHNLAQGKIKMSVYYFMPIMSFMIGVGISELAEHRWNNLYNMTWRHLIILVEFIILIFVALIPQGCLNILANVIVSFLCGMQAQAFRILDGKSFSSVMFTGNLKSAAERLSNFLITKESKALRTGVMFVFIIMVFIFGAFCGGLLTDELGAYSVLFVNVVLCVTFLIM